MIKKRALAAALALILLLTGCGGGEKESSSVQPPREEYDFFGSSAEENAGENAGEGEEKEGRDPGRTEPAQVVEELRQEMDGGYANETYGISFAPPESWGFYSVEKIMELYSLDQTLLDQMGEEQKRYTEEARRSIQFEMMAYDARSPEITVTVLFMDLAFLQMEGATEEEYMQSRGLSPRDGSLLVLESRTLSGQAFKTAATGEGAFRQRLYIRRQGDVMIEVRVERADDEACALIESYFS